MTRSWIEKTLHTGEPVDAQRLIKSLHASRDALKAERDNLSDQMDEIHKQWGLCLKELAAYKRAVAEYASNSGVAVDVHVERRAAAILAANAGIERQPQP